MSSLELMEVRRGIGTREQPSGLPRGGAVTAGGLPEWLPLCTASGTGPAILEGLIKWTCMPN